MKEDKIKEAFSKVKFEINQIKSDINEIKRTLNEIKLRQTIRHIPSTQALDRQTDNSASTDNSTLKMPLEGSKVADSATSTGNRGVSTDRQTDRQFDTSTGNRGVDSEKFAQYSNTNTLQKPDNNIEKAAEFIESLDDIKLQIRDQFKKLTTQEMLVFSAIYELEEKGFLVDYALLAQHLSLTQSSIRDYVQRMLKKGISIEKIRENNKKITLRIAQNLKKIASLSTILQLINQ